MRQFLGIGFDGVGQLQQQTSAFRAGECCPGREGPAGGGDGEVHVFRFGGGDAGDQRAVGGVQHVDLTAFQGGDEAAVDE
ncbi:hypothetical protein D3C76_1774400 [compost metagenome]